jgi:drug/metabolite transporter (DMT)-like permease
MVRHIRTEIGVNFRCSRTLTGATIRGVPRLGPATTGAALCVLSAVGFGTLGVFGRLAADAGADTTTTLAVRFALAALALTALAAARGARVRTVPRAAVGRALGLGAVGYSLQAGCYFAALARLDASLTAIVLYTYPAFVTVAALGLGRASADRRTFGALATASLGLLLALLGGGTGAFTLVGALLALAASLTYTTYILVSDGVTRTVPPLVLAALVCAGAALTTTAAGLVSGTLRLALPADAWLWLVLIALVSTVLPVTTFFAGLQRVGPSEAAILSTFEPPVTLVLAALALGERLAPVQLAGGALVLAAAVALQMRPRGVSAAAPAAAGAR